MIIAVLVVFIGVMLRHVEGDVFSAIAHIDSLLYAHKSVIDSIEVYLTQEKHRLDAVKNLLSHYKRNQKSMEQDQDYIGNPLNAFTLIKRLTADLELIDFFANKAYSTFNKNVNAYLPTMEDLEGAGLALLRIQTTYKLNVTQLSQGVIQGTYSHGNKPYFEKVSPISSSDLFELGRRAYIENDFQNALSWLLEALNRFKSRPKDDVVNFLEADLIDWIRACYHWLDDMMNALTWTEELVALNPDHAEAKARLVEYKNRVIEAQLLEDSQTIVQRPQHNPYDVPSNEVRKRYYDLCRGSPLPNNVTKTLHCYYKSGPEPFLNLARIKVELMHHDPAVLLFHDVISDAEIETVQHMAKNKLLRSTVNGGNGEALTAPYRVSKTAWFTDQMSPIVTRISQRVADFTDLSVEYAKQLQVANYGIGGHYEAHFDYLSNTQFSNEIGNRIATVMFYMSDVEQGGATTFTEFGLTVFPVKRSAIFWMNLLPSGEPDVRTRHGACPVLRGSKWVCNKWIHEAGQEFRRRCPQGVQK